MNSSSIYVSVSINLSNDYYLTIIDYSELGYTMNKYAGSTEIREIVTYMNIFDSDFYIDLMVSVFY